MFVITGPRGSGRTTAAIQRMLAEPDTLLLVSSPAQAKLLRPKHMSESDWMRRCVTLKTLPDVIRGNTYRIVVDNADEILAALMNVHASRFAGFVIQTEGSTRTEIEGGNLRIQAMNTKDDEELV